jgi:hypothetical protein
MSWNQVQMYMTIVQVLVTMLVIVSYRRNRSCLRMLGWMEGRDKMMQLLATSPSLKQFQEDRARQDEAYAEQVGYQKPKPAPLDGSHERIEEP